MERTKKIPQPREQYLFETNLFETNLLESSLSETISYVGEIPCDLRCDCQNYTLIARSAGIYPRSEPIIFTQTKGVFEYEEQQERNI